MKRSTSAKADVALAVLFAGALAGAANATPALTMDVTTGEVLYAQDATAPWFPASTTKLMTVYVALSAVRDHQIALDTPLVVSARAHSMPPSKMGFPVGTQVTLDNALKMLMVRSANDIAITVAEGVAGSVEAFADDMNQAATQLGLHESHFVNPNGLPDPDHYSSARDMALIARALYLQFPENAQLFNLGALALGSEIIPNHNNLLGRYPGVDGMKTGFTCSAGFNIVASAFRDGRRIVVVVFGAPSVAARSAKVAALFDRSFANIDRPIASIVSLAPASVGSPPDMHNEVCRNRTGLIAQFNAEVNALDAPLVPPSGGLGLNPEQALLYGGQASVQKPGQPEAPMALRINSLPQPVFDPVPVHIGADVGYAGVVAQARAPHTPVGSEPQPVAAIAYAAAPPTPQRIAGTPLAIDAKALPLRGRRTRLARARRGRPVLRAAAEAPSTQVIAESGAAAKTKGRKQAIGDSDDGAAKAKKPGKKIAKTPQRASKPAARPAKVAAKPVAAKTAGAKKTGAAKSAKAPKRVNSAEK